MRKDMAEMVQREVEEQMLDKLKTQVVALFANARPQ